MQPWFTELVAERTSFIAQGVVSSFNLLLFSWFVIMKIPVVPQVELLDLLNVTIFHMFCWMSIHLYDLDADSYRICIPIITFSSWLQDLAMQ